MSASTKKYYAYMRVSKSHQTHQRQEDAVKAYAKKHDIKYTTIFEDKATRANFSREQYQVMKDIVKPGDEIVVKELDRFGGDYELIRKELYYFQEMGVIVTILDIPSFNIDDPTLKKVITNIVIDLMGYIAQKELEKTKRRIREGMASSKKRGVKMGRPEFNVKDLPKDFNKYYKMYKNKDIKSVEFQKLLGCGKTTLYRWIGLYEEHIKKSK